MFVKEILMVVLASLGAAEALVTCVDRPILKCPDCTFCYPDSTDGTDYVCVPLAKKPGCGNCDRAEFCLVDPHNASQNGCVWNRGCAWHATNCGEDHCYTYDDERSACLLWSEYVTHYYNNTLGDCKK